MKSFIVLLIISSIISSSLCTLTQFGVATAITANTASTFTFDVVGAFQLSLTVDASTTFTLTPYFTTNFSTTIQADGAANISNGFSINTQTSFTISGSVLAGVKLSFSSSANIVAGSITIPGIYVFATTTYGLLEWSFTASAYAYVAPTSTGVSTITVPINNVGIFLVVNYNTGTFTRLPTLFSQNRTITPNSMSYSYPNGIFIDVSSTSANVFNVTFFSSNPQPVSPTHHTSQQKYIDINAAAATSVDANISFSYSSSQNANSLSIAFFDETTDTWTFPSSGLSVDTTNQLIVQSTTHFSTWALYTSSAASSSASCIVATWSALISAFVMLL